MTAFIKRFTPAQIITLGFVSLILIGSVLLSLPISVQDILFEIRTADHCSNIAVCVIDATENNMNMHESLRNMRKDNDCFEKKYIEYAKKYSIIDID